MTIDHVTDPSASAELMETPAFELECLYDDPIDPAELTIFAPGAETVATEWLTVDRSTAVSLDRIA